MATWQAWLDRGDGSITCGTVAQIADYQRRGQLGEDAELLYAFEAATHEEAQSIHHLRMGWAPYRPLGAPGECPSCGAIYYPEGSGECWRCPSPGPPDSERTT
jgi:hypothetical protein